MGAWADSSAWNVSPSTFVKPVSPGDQVRHPSSRKPPGMSPPGTGLPGPFAGFLVWDLVLLNPSP